MWRQRQLAEAMRLGYPYCWGGSIPARKSSGGSRRTKHEYLPAATLAGADATIAKPFRVDALLGTLRSLGV